jgi:hypothetical protein
MSEVTYYVALSIVASEDGITPAGAVECVSIRMRPLASTFVVIE